MKKFVGIIAILLAAVVANAQLNPVTWTFSAIKTSDKTFEVHMKAIMQSGWHLYSQIQPEDAIAIPTTFKVNNNPLLTLNGKIKEMGKLEKMHDAKLDISANQYSNTVEFIQTVKLKAKASTNFSGSVEYQTCDDKKCLPPKTVTFSVAL
ncbi:MAG: hypothetical protein JJE22_08690 [Bacteroidia bacterium]|nr:hypothetical protein [Bacteroidia bacterium]